MNVLVFIAILSPVLALVTTAYSLHRLKKKVKNEYNTKLLKNEYDIINKLLDNHRETNLYWESCRRLVESFKLKYGYCEESTLLENKLWGIGESKL